MSLISIFGTGSLLQATPTTTTQSGQGSGGFSIIMQSLSADRRNNLQPALQTGPADLQARNWSGNTANTHPDLIAQALVSSGSNNAPSGQFAEGAGSIEASKTDAQTILTSGGEGQVVVPVTGQRETDANVDASTNPLGSALLTEQSMAANSSEPTSDQALQPAELLPAASVNLSQANPMGLTTATAEIDQLGSTDPISKSGSATGLIQESTMLGKIPTAGVAIQEAGPVGPGADQTAKSGIMSRTGPDVNSQLNATSSAGVSVDKSLNIGLEPKSSNGFLSQSQHPAGPGAEPLMINKNMVAKSQVSGMAFGEETGPIQTRAERRSRSFEMVRSMSLEAAGRLTTLATAADPQMIADELPTPRAGVISPDFATADSVLHQIGKNSGLQKSDSVVSANNTLSSDFQLPPTIGTVGASAPLIDQAAAPPADQVVQKSHAKAVSEALLAQVKSADVQEGRTTINLQPRGLGSIEVEMMKEHDVTYKVIVRVENPVVLQMLREERHVLAQMIGISDSDVMSFDNASSDNHAATGNGAEASPHEQIGSDASELPVKTHQDVVFDGVLDVLT